MSHEWPEVIALYRQIEQLHELYVLAENQGTICHDVIGKLARENSMGKCATSQE